MINSVDRIPRAPFRAMGRDTSVAFAGEGPTVVLIHGSATYSYTWRNLIPYIARSHRCFAPDLLGMGRSDVVFPSGPGSYTFEDQFEHFELLMEVLRSSGPMVLIGHELGATIAIQYARKHPDSVAGLVLLEGAFRVANDALFEADLRSLLTDIRGVAGEHKVLIENAVIEEYLPRLTARVLGPAEMSAYREPHRKPGESRRAMLSMIRQLPLQSSPGPIVHLVQECRLWCAQSRIPKLVIGGSPGFLVPPSVLGTAARWANVTVASVRGLHFLTEDSPARLTALISDWLAEIGHTNQYSPDTVGR